MVDLRGKEVWSSRGQDLILVKREVRWREGDGKMVVMEKVLV